MLRPFLLLLTLTSSLCSDARCADDIGDALACYRREFAKLASYTTLEKCQGHWQITRLSVYSSMPTLFDAGQLGALTHVNTLRFSECSPVGLRALSELPHLRRLWLEWHVTEAEVQAICGLRQLKYVKFPDRTNTVGAEST